MDDESCIFLMNVDIPLSGHCSMWVFLFHASALQGLLSLRSLLTFGWTYETSLLSFPVSLTCESRLQKIECPL